MDGLSSGKSASAASGPDRSGTRRAPQLQGAQRRLLPNPLEPFPARAKLMPSKNNNHLVATANKIKAKAKRRSISAVPHGMRSSPLVKKLMPRLQSTSRLITTSAAKVKPLLKPTSGMSSSSKAMSAVRRIAGASVAAGSSSALAPRAPPVAVSAPATSSSSSLASSSSTANLAANIRVAVRVRPENEREMSEAYR